MFKKGQSGNPGGRPTVSKDIQEMAREYGPEAIKFLASVMRNGKAALRDRQFAADKLLDRGFGKPAQTLKGDPENPLIQATYTDEDRARVIDIMLAKQGLKIVKVGE